LTATAACRITQEADFGRLLSALGTQLQFGKNLEGGLLSQQSVYQPNAPGRGWMASRGKERCGPGHTLRLASGVEATEEEIKEFCQGQIAYYKIPEHVRFVTEFPATLSGKIQKYKIREFEIEARGLQDVAKTAMA